MYNRKLDPSRPVEVRKGTKARLIDSKHKDIHFGNGLVAAVEDEHQRHEDHCFHEHIKQYGPDGTSREDPQDRSLDLVNVPRDHELEAAIATFKEVYGWDNMNKPVDSAIRQVLINYGNTR